MPARRPKPPAVSQKKRIVCCVTSPTAPSLLPLPEAGQSRAVWGWVGRLLGRPTARPGRRLWHVVHAAPASVPICRVSWCVCELSPKRCVCRKASGGSQRPKTTAKYPSKTCAHALLYSTVLSLLSVLLVGLACMCACAALCACARAHSPGQRQGPPGGVMLIGGLGPVRPPPPARCATRIDSTIECLQVAGPQKAACPSAPPPLAPVHAVRHIMHAASLDRSRCSCNSPSPHPACRRPAHQPHPDHRLPATAAQQQQRQRRQWLRCRVGGRLVCELAVSGGRGPGAQLRRRQRVGWLVVLSWLSAGGGTAGLQA